METLKKYWGYFAGFIGTIFGLLMLRNYFQKDLKADAKNAETNLKNAVIEEKKSQNTLDMNELTKASKAAMAALEASKKFHESMTPAEIEEYYRKK